MTPVLRESSLQSISRADGRHWYADHCMVFLDTEAVPGYRRSDQTHSPGIVLLLTTTGQPLRSRGNSTDPDRSDRHKNRLRFPDFGSGVKLELQRLGPSMDPDAARPAPAAHTLAEASAYLTARLPCLQGAAVTATEVCHYENMPNGDFLVDRYPGTENVWLLGGGSGHGFKHAPAIAEYLLRLLEANAHPEPRFSLSPNRGASSRVL